MAPAVAKLQAMGDDLGSGVSDEIAMLPARLPMSYRAKPSRCIRSGTPDSRDGDNIKVQQHLVLVFNSPEKGTVGFIAKLALEQA